MSPARAWRGWRAFLLAETVSHGNWPSEAFTNEGPRHTSLTGPNPDRGAFQVSVSWGIARQAAKVAGVAGAPSPRCQEACSKAGTGPPAWRRAPPHSASTHRATLSVSHDTPGTGSSRSHRANPGPPPHSRTECPLRGQPCPKTHKHHLPGHCVPVQNKKCAEENPGGPGR